MMSNNDDHKDGGPPEPVPIPGGELKIWILSNGKYRMALPKLHDRDYMSAFNFLIEGLAILEQEMQKDLTLHPGPVLDDSRIIRPDQFRGMPITLKRRNDG